MKKIHLGFVQLYSDNYENDIELPDDFVMSETYRFTRDDGLAYQRYYVSIYRYDENLYKYLTSFDNHFMLYESLMFNEKKVVGDFEDEFVERLVELLHLGGIDV